MFRDKKKLTDVAKYVTFFSFGGFLFVATVSLFSGRLGNIFALLAYFVLTGVVLRLLSRWLWSDRTPEMRTILQRYLWGLVGGVGLAAYLWLPEPLANLWEPLGYIPITVLVIVLVVVQRRRKRNRTLSAEGT